MECTWMEEKSGTTLMLQKDTTALTKVESEQVN